MKLLKKDLQSVLKSLNALTQKLASIQERLDKQDNRKNPKAKTVNTKPVKKVALKKAVVKKANPTAIDTIVGIINRSRKGVTLAQLKDKTDFPEKKIWNLVYKGKKQGRIKSTQRGVYLKV